jgi:hypothetical protein
MHFMKLIKIRSDKPPTGICLHSRLFQETIKPLYFDTLWEARLAGRKLSLELNTYICIYESPLFLVLSLINGKEYFNQATFTQSSHTKEGFISEAVNDFYSIEYEIKDIMK